MGHFDLGRSYLEAGGHLQAEREFDRCLTRRGEAVSLFLDEEPTYGHFPVSGGDLKGTGSPGSNTHSL